MTVVLYGWDVAPTARWMNPLAPAARPAWNHDRVMHAGRVGLAARAGGRLLDSS